jgi:hypothetical protein
MGNWTLCTCLGGDFVSQTVSGKNKMGLNHELDVACTKCGSFGMCKVKPGRRNSELNVLAPCR